MNSGARPLITAGSLTEVHDEAQMPLGSIVFDRNQNEYVYGKGVGSTVEGSVVTFDEDHNTALITANAVGRVGVAMAAIVANKFGFYQVKGKNLKTACDTIADNKACFIDGTNGRVDDAVVTGDLIVGMISRSTDTSNFCQTELNYPFVTDVLG